MVLLEPDGNLHLILSLWHLLFPWLRRLNRTCLDCLLSKNHDVHKSSIAQIVYILSCSLVQVRDVDKNVTQIGF